jgi:hypothetical protein
MALPAVLVSGLSSTRVGAARRSSDSHRPVGRERRYGRTSFAKRAMQLETALRSPALATQLSNM